MFALTRLLNTNVTIEQVAAVVQAKINGIPTVNNTIIVDVRSTGEVAATGVIPTAVNIPLKMLDNVLSDDVGEDEFMEIFRVPKPQKDLTQLIFYCAHGVRSAIATEIAEGLGYRCANNFSGSFTEWYNRYGEDSNNENQKKKNK